MVQLRSGNQVLCMLACRSSLRADKPASCCDLALSSAATDVLRVCAHVVVLLVADNLMYALLLLLMVFNCAGCCRANFALRPQCTGRCAQLEDCAWLQKCGGRLRPCVRTTTDNAAGAGVHQVLVNYGVFMLPV
jgi:hypothetical protein